jgi:hypothetical protein
MAADVTPLRYRLAKARSAGRANGPIVALSDELAGPLQTSVIRVDALAMSGIAGALQTYGGVPAGTLI